MNEFMSKRPRTGTRSTSTLRSVEARLVDEDEDEAASRWTVVTKRGARILEERSVTFFKKIEDLTESDWDVICVRQASDPDSELHLFQCKRLVEDTSPRWTFAAASAIGAKTMCRFQMQAILLSLLRRPTRDDLYLHNKNAVFPGSEITLELAVQRASGSAANGRPVPFDCPFTEELEVASHMVNRLNGATVAGPGLHFRFSPGKSSVKIADMLDVKDETGRARLYDMRDLGTMTDENLSLMPVAQARVDEEKELVEYAAILRRRVATAKRASASVKTDLPRSLVGLSISCLESRFSSRLMFGIEGLHWLYLGDSKHPLRADVTDMFESTSSSSCSVRLEAVAAAAVESGLLQRALALALPDIRPGYLPELEQEMTVSSVIDARLTVHPSCLVLVPKMLHRFVLREPRYWVHLDNPYHRYAVRTATTHAKCLAELASHEENVQAQKPRP
jgi:hypothetical protein